MNVTAEKSGTLWMLAASPAIWSAHFLLSYLTAAVWCGKLAGAAASLGPARVAIGAYTLVGLAGIAIVGYVGYRWHTFGSGVPPHDADTPEDRRRFLGFATLLLTGLSAVGIVYSALAAVFIETCQ